MNAKLFACLIILLCSSCARILYTKTYNLRVVSPGAHDSILVDNRSYALPATVNVSRSKHDLPVTLISGATSRDYVLKAKPNPVFLVWNASWYVLAPVAYGLDFTSPKRFYYGNAVQLGPGNKISPVRSGRGKRFFGPIVSPYETHKGQMNFTGGVTLLNSFYFQPRHQPSKKNSGMIGVTMGIEHYYRDKRYLSFEARFSTDINLSLDEDGVRRTARERMYSDYLSLTNNHKLGRFYLGYGINFAFNTWSIVYENPQSGQSQTLTNKSFGITTKAYYQIAKPVFLGIIYNPSLLQVSPVAIFKYESLISVDLSWKLNVGRSQ